MESVDRSSQDSELSHSESVAIKYGLPESLIQKLEKEGWSATCNLTIDIVNTYTNKGFQMNDAAQEFLGVFGGLSFELINEENETIPISFGLKLSSSAELRKKMNWHKEKIADLYLSPIGTIDALPLMISDDGQYFHFTETGRFKFCGTDMTEVLDYSWSCKEDPPSSQESSSAFMEEMLRQVASEGHDSE
eukprot:TRINITY_DN2070_c0_g1_i2.p2 TRINITY_DN2070_c0_g1~~TRINITY_DN2070_c0_g1_i2.p2  ORF type:complete len:191 (-),score=37.15 TRINITY_DN2070_c0_g1_i2:1037-1609(-)